MDIALILMSARPLFARLLVTATSLVTFAPKAKGASEIFRLWRRVAFVMSHCSNLLLPERYFAANLAFLSRVSVRPVGFSLRLALHQSASFVGMSARGSAS